MDGLAMVVQQVLAEDSFGGAVYAFRGRRGSLLKLLWYDGIGLCLLVKRLERGHFVWPMTSTGAVSLSQHDGGFLVAPALLAATAPGHLAGQAAGLPRLLPVHA